MRTIKCKDCGVDVQTIANNTTRCKACSLEAKREAKRKWANSPDKIHMCECGRAPKVHRNTGCPECNAANDARYVKRYVAADEYTEHDWGDWAKFSDQWLREERARQASWRRLFNPCTPLSQQAA